MKVKLTTKAFIRGQLMKKGTVTTVADAQFDPKIMVALEAPKPVAVPKKD